MINNDEYLTRRKEVLLNMKDNSIAILFSGKRKLKSNLQYFPFEVNKNFYYLTGICQENCALMLLKSSSQMKEFLFVEESSEAKKKFVGERISLTKATQISGIENVLLFSSFNSRVNYYLSSTNLVDQIETLYLDSFEDSEMTIFENVTLKEYGNSIFASYPNIEIESLTEFLINQRLVKSKDEVIEIKEAVRRNVIAFQQAMKSLKPNLKLFEVGISFLESALSNSENEAVPFSPIIASNEDVCLLKNDNVYERIKNDDFVLIDGGCQANLYNSRLARTIPVGGNFSPIQSKLYTMVLNCQKILINACQIGISFNELQSMAFEYLAEECLKEKLILKKEDIKLHLYHNVISHIGLDVPDVGFKGNSVNKGNVLTISPGLYFPELKLGVRITDVVYISGKSIEVLSSSLIKEITDIEEFYGIK